MNWGVILVGVLSLLQGIVGPTYASGRVNPDAIPICSLIVSELTEGRIRPKDAEPIVVAIAEAANRHFGSVTNGDMWLYMAIVHIESGFRTKIVNYQNCRGMFQVHAPSWATKFGIRYADLFDPGTNADAGIRVFKYYLELYKKVIPALSAYNSDHPMAATGYARAVLNTRRKIMKRYVQIHRALSEARTFAARTVPYQVHLGGTQP